MERAFFDMFGVNSKVDLKYRSIEERRKENPLPEDFKERLAEAERWWNMPFRELFDNEFVTYSKYHNLLEEHRRLTNPKVPRDDSDVIDVPMD